MNGNHSQWKVLLAAGQLEVHASGECQRALQHLEKDVINEERQATPLMPEPTPGVPIRVFCQINLLCYYNAH
ncbi:hypothetical protein PI126_g20467 [Phytophthora idaei]|nr:hypothetical protein PI126_g20467 [Phytophthora idaei]